MADAWSLRQLCDDGACTGVIRSDGRCSACGKVALNWGDERRRGLLDEDEAERRTEEHVVRREPGPAPEGFEERRLCPDGGCVGLLDARGVCKVCGAVGAAAGRKKKGGKVGELSRPVPAMVAGAVGEVDPVAGAEAEAEGESEAASDSDSNAEAGSGSDGDSELDDDSYGERDDMEGEADDDDDGEGDDDGGEGDDDAADDGEDEDEAGDAKGDVDDVAVRAARDDDAGEDRELCPDGGCIGLIGADGRCKVCGRAGERRS